MAQFLNTQLSVCTGADAASWTVCQNREDEIVRSRATRIKSKEYLSCLQDQTCAISSSNLLHKLEEEWDLDTLYKLFSSSKNLYRTAHPHKHDWEKSNKKPQAVEITEP